MPKGDSLNTPATAYWHQGYGRINHDGVEVVPFLTQETTRRVAALAARNGFASRVIRIGDLWAYLEEEE